MAEPQHIKEILPSVMQSIVRQANRYREKHNLPTLQEEIRLKDEVSEKDTIFSVHSLPC